MRIAKNLLICLLISFTAIFGFVQLTNLCVAVFESIGLEIADSVSQAQQVNDIQNNFLLFFIMSAILPPIYEELTFRVGGVKLFRWVNGKDMVSIVVTILCVGAFVSAVFLLAGSGYMSLLLILLSVVAVCLKTRKKPQSIPNIYIILLTAVIFMVYHHSWSQTVYQFLLGVIFAVIYIKTNNIFYTMFIHFINNAFVVIYTYYNGLGAENGYSINFTTVSVAVCLAVAACGILYSLIKELPNGQKK
jgi:membrane protease YdiL (CAAX protease family)